MLDQAFSPSCLMRLVQREDVARFRMWRPTEDRNAVMVGISNAINDPAFVFPSFQKKSMKGKTIYSAPDASTMLALRKLDRNIRTIYKVKQANRDDMVHQVKSLLREGCSFTVLRLDIRSFYESIDRNKILDLIHRDSIVSHRSRVMLRKFFEAPQIAETIGLPRGFAISATLAELYMRKFDNQIRAFKHAYFYGRYVDDIIVFTHASGGDAEKDISSALNTVGLKLNSDKQTIVEYHAYKKNAGQSNQGFNFLGYNFECPQYPTRQNDWRNVRVRIAPSKIKKFKSRIAHSLVNHAAAPDFHLLYRRLRFLTGNHTLRRGKNGGLRGGIHYNYFHINDIEHLKDLDDFLRRLIFCRKGSLGTRLDRTLTTSQRRQLAKLSFRTGFKQRFSHSLPWGTMKNIHRCWMHEKN